MLNFMKCFLHYRHCNKYLYFLKAPMLQDKSFLISILQMRLKHREVKQLANVSSMVCLQNPSVNIFPKVNTCFSSFFQMVSRYTMILSKRFGKLKFLSPLLYTWVFLNAVFATWMLLKGFFFFVEAKKYTCFSGFVHFFRVIASIPMTLLIIYILISAKSCLEFYLILRLYVKSIFYI